MFLDTNFNSPNTVLLTIYQNFVEVAMKYYRYGKLMVHSSQPHLHLLIGKIRRASSFRSELWLNVVFAQVPYVIWSILHLFS